MRVLAGRLGHLDPDRLPAQAAMSISPWCRRPMTQVGASGGSVGVIGPMRMNYKRAISAVEEVSRELEDQIGSRDKTDPWPRTTTTILGVGRDATTEEIKKAFRRVAAGQHPDANPG